MPKSVLLLQSSLGSFECGSPFEVAQECKENLKSKSYEKAGSVPNIPTQLKDPAYSHFHIYIFRIVHIYVMPNAFEITQPDLAVQNFTFYGVIRIFHN